MAFSGSKHLKRKNVVFEYDLDGKPYVCLGLPSAKMVKLGEIQQVFLTPQGSVCPIEALNSLFAVIPATENDILFLWTDGHKAIRPIVHSMALAEINKHFQAGGWENAFGHSFSIGGASFFLSQGVDPEIVQLMGRWKSLAYKTYIQAFEQVASKHTQSGFQLWAIDPQCGWKLWQRAMTPQVEMG